MCPGCVEQRDDAPQKRGRSWQWRVLLAVAACLLGAPAKLAAQPTPPGASHAVTWTQLHGTARRAGAGIVARTSCTQAGRAVAVIAVRAGGRYALRPDYTAQCDLANTVQLPNGVVVPLRRLRELTARCPLRSRTGALRLTVSVSGGYGCFSTTRVRRIRVRPVAHAPWSAKKCGYLWRMIRAAAQQGMTRVDNVIATLPP